MLNLDALRFWCNISPKSEKNYAPNYAFFFNIHLSNFVVVNCRQVQFETFYTTQMLVTNKSSDYKHKWKTTN